jgi:hypothetical protein
MAGATQVFRGGNHHTLFRVTLAVWAVAGLTGYAGQHELPRDGTVTRGVAGEAFARFFYPLQIFLEDWVK